AAAGHLRRRAGAVHERGQSGEVSDGAAAPILAGLQRSRRFDHHPMSFDPEEIHVKPFVYETRKTKSLHFSIAEVQSCMDMARPDSLDLSYTRTMMGFLLFQPKPFRRAQLEALPRRRLRLPAFIRRDVHQHSPGQRRVLASGRTNR